MRVKLFGDMFANVLEQKINEWLEKDEYLIIHDIRLSSAPNSRTVAILYEEKTK